MKHSSSRNQRTTTGKKIAGIVVALFIAALLSVVASYPAFRPLDFLNYRTATSLLLQGENPYQTVEFFAPTWSVIFLAPFALLPLSIASGIWTLISSGSQFITGAIATDWLEIPRGKMHASLLVLVAILPPALYTYLTGQVSSFISLALLLALKNCSQNKVHPVRLACLFAISCMKPHLSAIPILLCVLELIRKKNFSILFWTCIVFSGFIAFSFFLLPEWFLNMLQAWLGGAYRGGPGRAAPGYLGLLELGVPYILFIPTLIYLFYDWNVEGLTDHVTAIALSTSLLLAPYTRAYDQVLLVLPFTTAFSQSSHKKVIPTCFLLAAGIILPITPYWTLAPVFTLIGLLLLPKHTISSTYQREQD